MALDDLSSTSAMGIGPTSSPASPASKPVPPPKPERKKLPSLVTTPAAAAEVSSSTTTTTTPVLQEQTLEELEQGETLRSPFTSTSGVWDSSGSMEGLRSPPRQPSSSSSSPSSLLDLIPMHVAIPVPVPAPLPRIQQLSPLALAEDGLLTLSSPSSDGEGDGESTTTSDASPSPSHHADDLLCVSPPPLSTPTTTITPSSASQPVTKQRRLSLPGLALRSTPRSGGSGGFATLESLRAKLGQTITPRATLKASTPVVPTTTTSSSSFSFTPELDNHDGLLVQSARRLGLDITGLRQALLVRILGTEPITHPPTSSLSSPNTTTPTTTTGTKASKRNRSASAGMMPVAWLKRSKEGGAGGGDTWETYTFLIWVYDVESGQEWRVRKGPLELLALYEVVLALCPGGLWVEKGKFPLKLNKSETESPSAKEQTKLERYLRRLAGAMELPTPPPTGGSYLDVAKTLQDWLGATERVDELEQKTHAAARGDPRRYLRQQVQVQVVEILRRGGGWVEKLEAFVEKANNCDIHKTELLKAYGLFLDLTAQEMVETPAHKEALVGFTRMSLASPSLVSGSGEIDEAEVTQFCVSAVRRVLEAETFLSLREALYARVTLETDMVQERQLARKCVLFQTRPQSFFGIPVDNISVSSWETAVEHIKRLSGDVTSLPCDKLDALVQAKQEVDACFLREHGAAGGVGLSGDDFLPIFIYVVAQSGISRLLSLKTMLVALADPAHTMSEVGYSLASLEGSIEYLLQLDETAGEI